LVSFLVYQFFKNRPDAIPNCLANGENVPVIVCDGEIFAHVQAYLGERRETKNEDDDGSTAVILLRDEKDGYHSIRGLLDGETTLEGEDVFTKSETAIVGSHDDEAAVFFSSGSTGPPKPIIHTHRSLLSLTHNTYR
jgi:acyl-coenzyme A synthetase/AMP-(fatty) acid ligase